MRTVWMSSGTMICVEMPTVNCVAGLLSPHAPMTPRTMAKGMGDPKRISLLKVEAVKTGRAPTRARRERAGNRIVRARDADDDAGGDRARRDQHTRERPPDPRLLRVERDRQRAILIVGELDVLRRRVEAVLLDDDLMPFARREWALPVRHTHARSVDDDDRALLRGHADQTFVASMREVDHERDVLFVFHRERLARGHVVLRLSLQAEIAREALPVERRVS